MIVVADEHLSPRIVRAVREIALSRDWTFECLSDTLRGSEDEDWVQAVATSGANAILSADRAMLKRPTLLAKISQHGIIGIYLPAEWAASRRNYQAAHILYWWPSIEGAIRGRGGSAWIVPKGFNATAELREHIVSVATVDAATA